MEGETRKICAFARRAQEIGEVKIKHAQSAQALKGRQFTAGGERSVTPGKWVIIKNPPPVGGGRGRGFVSARIIYLLPQRIAGRTSSARSTLSPA